MIISHQTTCQSAADAVQSYFACFSLLEEKEGSMYLEFQAAYRHFLHLCSRIMLCRAGTFNCCCFLPNEKLKMRCSQWGECLLLTIYLTTWRMQFNLCSVYISHWYPSGDRQKRGVWKDHPKCGSIPVPLYYQHTNWHLLKKNILVLWPLIFFSKDKLMVLLFLLSPGACYLISLVGNPWPLSWGREEHWTPSLIFPSRVRHTPLAELITCITV